MKLTSEQSRALTSAAELLGMTESEFSRRAVAGALNISPSDRLHITAQAISEERIRIMFEAARKGKDLNTETVKSEAISAGIQLAEERIATLLSLRLDMPK
jgi:hypothetical protein